MLSEQPGGRGGGGGRAYLSLTARGGHRSGTIMDAPAGNESQSGSAVNMWSSGRPPAPPPPAALSVPRAQRAVQRACFPLTPGHWRVQSSAGTMGSRT